MPTKERSKNRATSYGAIFILVIVGINFFVLSNEIIRNEIIEFLLPVLERFLHQPEMDIVSVRKMTIA